MLLVKTMELLLTIIALTTIAVLILTHYHFVWNFQTISVHLIVQGFSVEHAEPT